MQRGTAMLESGTLAYRRLENGELEILLVSKTRSKRWAIPKGRVYASLSFGETAAKEVHITCPQLDRRPDAPWRKAESTLLTIQTKLWVKLRPL